MLYLTEKKSENIILNVGKVFAQLRFKEVKPYLTDMLNYGAFQRINSTQDSEYTLQYIICETKFGCTYLSNISTSIQVLILSKLAIKNNKAVCFAVGVIGDNYLEELMSICKNTDLISLYCPTGIMPQITCTARKILEDELRKRLGNRWYDLG